ncbi:hypothetical protein ACFORH_28495 [Amycolatopsis roodepoortensis]|uniref:Imidazolonepropionase-like amidohydrolase n=1 Tax=Amycolatopsis roodepoortensis TaxID=700274 RepID=A0ABR9LHK5_9PSEU|nr:hypothetical protein [Amycolatopsis roodepoortensis]MBE1580160.1 imidazolonepropionase-like amidohydrolase [Amycolatopsis roodepoortensis]
MLDKACEGHPAESWFASGVEAHPALAKARLRTHEALAAGSWAARDYLGVPGLAPGAPADAVVYAEDPREDLGQLEHPVAVILRDVRVR